MPCYSPLEGYWSRRRNPSGKRGVVFSASEGFLDRPVKVPCGQCVGCRLERSRQWAIRLMHERAMHEENCFITLTYDDKHLPPYGSLRKSDFQKFMKRLRKANSDKRIRYFHCGEYGDITGRPHYHAILFGIDFSDRYSWAVRKGHPTFRSRSLENLWKDGHSEIGSVTFESAAYVARYVMKKRTGKDSAKHYERMDPETGEVVELEREYCTMSRRPGIGSEWLERYGHETYRDDTVVMRGREMRPPRFYDDKYEVVEPELVAEAKAKRQAKRDRKEETPERMEAREACAYARLSRLERSMI